MTLLLTGLIALMALLLVALGYGMRISPTAAARGASAGCFGAILGILLAFFSPIGSQGRLAQVEVFLYFYLSIVSTAAGVPIAVFASFVFFRVLNRPLAILCGVAAGMITIAIVGYAAMQAFGHWFVGNDHMTLYGATLHRESAVICALSGITSGLAEIFSRPAVQRRSEAPPEAEER